MDCSKITAGFVGGACGALPTGGTGQRVWLMNYEDIDRANCTLDADGNISAIAMKTGKYAYLYETIDNANEASATFNKGTYVNNYDHSITLRIFKDNIAAKKFVNQLSGARIVAVVERKCVSSCDNIFEVYGWDSGLKMSENPYSTTLTDNVAMAPVLTSDDISKETTLPRTYTGTEASLNALCEQSNN